MRTPRRSLVLPALLTALALAVGSAPGTLAASVPAPAQAVEPARDSDAELLGLHLLNCTRTGGWVRADGSCKGRATGAYSPYVRPLRLHEVLSTEVAYRWASELVLADACDHVLPGRPVLATRLTTAGFDGASYGENVGCSWGGMATRAMVISTHRAMQAEKASRGGHWRNIKERSYRKVGIGVATLEGMTVVVYDFYGG